MVLNSPWRCRWSFAEGKMIKIVIADDQILFSETLKIVLESRSEEIRVIGLAHTGRQTITMAEELKPDIVLLDIRMPEMDGVQTTKILHERFPDLQILILTTYDDDDYILDALRYGAVGYILKSVSPDRLIDNILAVKHGNILISQEALKKLIARAVTPFPGDAESKKTDAPDNLWYDVLSKREREILRLLADGLDNKQIADRLFLAEQTVKNHISVIYSKMEVRDRVKLAMLARTLSEKERYP
jgi:DNA-binding NarL/FixJ family response regulator